MIMYLLCAIVGYLIGSVSTGVLLSRFLGGDVREAGSKNAGASNMLRVYGLRPGICTFIGDCLKAVIAVLLGWLFAGHNGLMLCGLFAVIGHNWPVFFGFRGGKGVASTGALIVLAFPAFGIPAALVCLLIIALTRYISLGSLSMNLLFALLVYIFKPIWPYGVWALLLAGMSCVRHRTNIHRLINGTERKLGEHEKPV